MCAGALTYGQTICADHMLSAKVADMDQDPHNRLPLATLHECLTPPAAEETLDARVTLRFKPSVLHKLEAITQRHGIDVGTFFRNCAERVIAEVG
jgi:hypothetical protein